MSWLKGLFGGNDKAPAKPALPFAHELPLGLRINGRVAFDTMMYRAHPQAWSAQLPEGHQGIPCYGHIDLGGGHALHRFYLDDDAYLQVSTASGQIEGIKAFMFQETVNPPNQAAFQRFIHEHPHLGADRIEYAGRTWYREFGDGEAAAKVPAVVYDEVLYRHDPPRRDDDLTHYAMLYRREVAEPEREEFLLVTAEDYGPSEFVVTYAIGLDLTTADLDIT
ncbi:MULTISPECIES: DUF2491 family protein [Lysobacter]|uniref:DUF2491 family protein n=1 Tax=Lysobacter firmicutimachus TaxID=1792846 RepID=A0ABU8DAS9_9GAMM|nr:DUF2491 family protein [Lysobacter antibioticus]